MITGPVSAGSNVNNRLDYNLYDCPGGPAQSIWKWNRQRLIGFTAWKTTSGQDAHSLFSDPKFVKSGDRPNLHLRAGSPAINAGDPAFKPARKERDIEEEKRETGGRVDIGADEW